MSTKAMIDEIRLALSAARLGRYESTAGVTAPDDSRAIELYAWHAQVSAALLAPLHICEVVVRNTVSEALEAVYGPQWPWSPGFEQALPPVVRRSRHYQPLLDVRNTRVDFTTTGKVIPALKFVFWQKMFTARHDNRLWTPHLRRVLPNVDPNQSIQTVRKRIYADLEQIRALRNRVAHHEPIFLRDLAADQTLQNNLNRVNFSLVLVGVMEIADEVDSQLAQAMTSYVAQSKIDALPITA